MQRFITVALVSAFLALSGCSRVEGTGRERLLLTTPEQEKQQGLAAFAQVQQQEKPANDPEGQAFVERVGKRLVDAIHRTYAKDKVPPDQGFEWQFTLFQSDQVNAFCLPGGKVAVYTAILPYCENEAALATVLGHEIAHAIARHGGERMTDQMIEQFGSTGLAAFLQAKGVSPTASNLTLAAYGGGAQLGVMLPFSRTQESEADYLGLKYMAAAGYDPQEAVKFWDRFAKLAGTGPAFFSDHPASDERAKALRAKLGEAQAISAKAPAHYGAGDPVPARYRK